MWLTIIEIALKLGIFVFNWFGAKEENYKWMTENLKAVRQKKLARARKVVESVEEQIKEQDTKWDEIEKGKDVIKSEK